MNIQKKLHTNIVWFGGPIVSKFKVSVEPLGLNLVCV